MKSYITRLTGIIYQSLVYNHHILPLKLARDVNDMKKMIAEIYFKGNKPSPEFIKGAKFINWDAIYKRIQVA